LQSNASKWQLSGGAQAQERGAGAVVAAAAAAAGGGGGDARFEPACHSKRLIRFLVVWNFKVGLSHLAVRPTRVELRRRQIVQESDGVAASILGERGSALAKLTQECECRGHRLAQRHQTWGIASLPSARINSAATATATAATATATATTTTAAMVVIRRPFTCRRHRCAALGVNVEVVPRPTATRLA
jgi:hypothetical protein